MHISDETLIAYLERNANRKPYILGDGAVFRFRLEPSPQLSERMPYRVVLYSSRSSAWQKDQEIAARFALECLDKYNGGAKIPDRFVAKTGARSASRRGRYFCELLRDLEEELIRSGGQYPTGEAHP